MRNKTLRHRVTAFLCLLCIALSAITSPLSAQDGRKVTGHIVDDTNEPLIGASILVVGTSTGVITDLDGNFSIVVPSGATTLQISYVGYETMIVPIPDNNTVNVKMKSDSQVLSDVVVIGYGTTRKSDLTGSVSNVSSKDFNSGLISSPEQLINGKVSGVQIMSNSGSPTAGSTIRIRGGASLNASNDPLIVLDGVPLETGGISGNDGNFLALINPSDIESMTILKDASSTAIYGSRASNGVIIITTKKGSTDRMKVSFTTTNSIQTRTKLNDMLSREEFINVVNTQGSDAQKALLGNANTDWNDKIYHNAFGTDNNLSLSGRLAKNFPIRVSLGYYNQDGLVKTDNAERITGSVSLSPSFFDDHLKLNFNVKGSRNDNRFANSNAIWNAATWNPTIPVYSGNNTFGGYTEATDNVGQLVTGGTVNPLGALKQYKSTSRVSRLVGNFDVDYKMHFLPELKFHATLGYDYAKGQGKIYVPAEAAQYETTHGRDYKYGPQKNTNRLLTTYFNYNKYLDSWKSSIDATVGYDYQYWKSTSPQYSELSTLGEIQSTTAASDERHVLLSYYARLNYTFDSRYMLTATMRRDGTSRFSKDNRWGTFPSVALAWRVSEEAFLKDNAVLSNLKLRASYGVTGQQDGIGNYNYLPVYTASQSGAEAQFGNQYITTYRPEAYVSNLKWETTTAWNAGFDFGFLEDRITGSFDYYTRQTKDLLATVASPAGTNFDKNILTNVGNVDSQGIEVSLNASPIQSKNWNWDVSFNMTWQKMKVKNLSLVEGGAATNISAGASIDGQNVQVLSEGYEPYMFYVYKQLYDAETGKPIEGAYADLNNDGEINSGDLYRYKSPTPDFIFGFSTSLNYKKWTLSTSLRANVGNYVYNGMAMNTGAWETMSYNAFQLNNVHSSYLETGFQRRQHLSDYYVENGSFLKMDNLSLSYNFGRVCRWLSLNASVMVQNVFCITKYSGVDPEVPSGMDSSFYPRPRTYSLSLGLEF
ncbi:SusC/RagA family TonB-linked outer membrane protein [Bacteroides cellulosilyticus]|uniref:SusC/RagA family TonB-linked outer membrane protein n=1 Tax=Bacteroides cellulosilyticus TaxID=246787 RepID=UPI001C37B438|nr:TonB-dependent receptor [Bacteroides cellulosilyticus]MBV3637213.1 TonB-dependent receptor [Bacteroides cellulosilyticus]MBV3663539.1 TonB-dependent receptor [Bacteroides cellulosilyticus]MBV3685660.1 TonB-dependent receptor [Bacteroides cellulosilyticus]MBV3694217.1 TonB-dependent receptor [Bacteroides cellulosilyticus]MBV3707858.1 TonB-dependent receptor [Bacteroides cellulosilyticus]